MKTEDILTVEESGENTINLVRDRLFWQAWNKSAFLFVTHIKKYQVHKRFVQKVSQEVAWLGFPKNALAKIEETAKTNGWAYEQKSADHIAISGIPPTSGYEEWWSKIVKIKPKPADADDRGVLHTPLSTAMPLLPAYRTAYDLCLHIHRATVKMPKEFRHELGARVRNYATDIAEMLHTHVGARHALPSDNTWLINCGNIIRKLQMDTRILKDLHQISVKQWGFLNLQIENLLNLLRAEFCNRIYPIFDRKFIYDSYSCRVGKGTLFGIKRVQEFLKSCGASVGATPCGCPALDNCGNTMRGNHATIQGRNYTIQGNHRGLPLRSGNDVWVLRLDIRGFFMSINREILYELVMNELCKCHALTHRNAPTECTQFLIKKIVFNNPLQNARYKSPPNAWANLPKDKSLKFSATNCGLPIGNLTSQVFANVYLNPVDHFVKRELKIKYYGRYVDDMVLIHSDKQVLLNAILQIRDFLSEKLKLTLHPRKIKLQPASKGFEFLGVRISPFGLQVGTRVTYNFRECIFDPNPNLEKQAQRVQSYLGFLKSLS